MKKKNYGRSQFLKGHPRGTSEGRSKIRPIFDGTENLNVEKEGIGKGKKGEKK